MFRKLLDLLSDAAVYGISSLLSQAIGFLLLPVYTRYLMPEDQGVIAMLGIVAMLFSPLANLGMTNAIFRRFNLDKEERERGRVLSSALCSVTISSLTLMTIMFIFADEIARLVVGDASTTGLVRLSLLSAAATTVGTIPFTILRASRRVKAAAAINVSKLLISVFCTIWLVVVLERGVWGVVVGSLVGETIMTLVQYAVTFRSFRFRASLETWKRLASYGLPFVPHHVQAVGLALFGQYMVREMLGLSEAGLYSIAMKFAMPVTFIVNAVQNSWVAYKFQIHAEDDDPKAFFRSTLTYYVAGILYLWVGVSLWGPELLRLMTAETYHSAASLIWAVSLIPVAQGIYFMSGTGIELTDNTRPYPLITLAGLITVVTSAFVFVKGGGAFGAAMATVLGWIVMSFTILMLSRRRFPIPYDWSTLSLLIFLALGAETIGYWSFGLPLIPRLALALLVSLAFPLAEFGILLRSSTERHRMRIIWEKIRQFRRGRSLVKAAAK